ncbi:MAG: hypothetical protein U1F76_16925 [Candidatus Competibacteraceae bacterium]
MLILMPFGRKLRQLQREVRELEWTLADERQQIDHCYQTLRTGVRRKLVSPTMLMGGFVAGFVAGRLPGRSRRKAAEPPPSLLGTLLRTSMKTLVPALLTSQLSAYQAAQQTEQRTRENRPAA